MKEVYVGKFLEIKDGYDSEIFMTNEIVKVRYVKDESIIIEDVGRILDIKQGNLILDCSKECKSRIEKIDINSITRVITVELEGVEK